MNGVNRWVGIFSCVRQRRVVIRRFAADDAGSKRNWLRCLECCDKATLRCKSIALDERHRANQNAVDAVRRRRTTFGCRPTCDVGVAGDAIDNTDSMNPDSLT